MGRRRRRMVSMGTRTQLEPQGTMGSGRGNIDHLLPRIFERGAFVFFGGGGFLTHGERSVRYRISTKRQLHRRDIMMS